MSSHLKLSAGVADLVDIGQRTSVVRCASLRQTELLNLLKLHLRVKSKSTVYCRSYRPKLDVSVTQAAYSALKQKLLQHHEDPTFGSFPVAQKR